MTESRRHIFIHSADLGARGFGQSVTAPEEAAEEMATLGNAMINS